MHNKIRKRDGRYVKFNAEKITNAIARAGAATGEFEIHTPRKLTIKVLSLAEKLFDDKIMGVEDIQDIVEEVLLSSPYRRTTKAYIIYREQHARLREIANKMEVDLVDQYLKKIDWKINENSNMDYSLQGLNNYISSEVSKVYWLNEIYPQEVRAAHTEGDFHIHDLSILSVYCVGWDLFDLLTEGFKGVSGKVESKPAKHLRSALGQIVNFFYTLQGEAAGAQAFSNFDTLLAPFIRYDNLNYKEAKQALQEFIFNINVPTRVGFQTPFTNVTMDVTVPEYYANQNVIIGGRAQKETYRDFQKEMGLFNKAFLEVMAEGDAKGRPFTFPIPTYNITKDFEWDNENYIPIWEMTRKYGIPYFSNFVNSDMKPEDAKSMCCRLRLDLKQLAKRGGGLFGSNPLTGSIGVVTINMPRIAYLSETEREFFERLEKLMEMAEESLIIKRKVIEKLTNTGLYPYSRHYLRDIKKRLGEYWKNHFSTIGLIGMNEACLNFEPYRCTIGDESGRKFALRVFDFMREKLLNFQEEEGDNYNLEATPAEGTSYSLALLDKERFPDIISQGSGSGVFYTNSSQLPVNWSDDIFEVLDSQDEIQCKYTGGTVIHIFLGESLTDYRSVKNLARKVINNYKLPYFTITPTFSICPMHGYIPGEHPTCPICEEEKKVKIKAEIQKLKDQLEQIEEEK